MSRVRRLVRALWLYSSLGFPLSHILSLATVKQRLKGRTRNVWLQKPCAPKSPVEVNALRSQVWGFFCALLAKAQGMPLDIFHLVP